MLILTDLTITYLQIIFKNVLTQSAGAAEYTNCTSAEW